VGPGVDKIAFTGEYKTAQQIMADATPTLKRLTFELGGKSPNIVFADADLDAAVAGSHFALYFNHGQCCCDGSRLFVEDKVYDRVVEKIADRNREYRVGDPFDPQTEQGPQVDEGQFDKVLHYIDQGKAEGAHCVTGGGRVGHRGYFAQPTLFADVTDDMKIAQDEIFGPVLSALRFSDLEEVAQRANRTLYGLAAGIWTRDVKKAHYLAAKIRAGTV
jgi:aldehyde dehydrogenase (NAD+)